MAIEIKSGDMVIKADTVEELNEVMKNMQKLVDEQDAKEPGEEPQIEESQSEAEFKVGDRVKIVGETKYHEHPIGSIGEVVERTDHDIQNTIVDVAGFRQYHVEQDLELVKEEETSEQTPEFKEGDKVVVIADKYGHRVPVGTVTTVREVQEFGYDDHIPYLITPEEGKFYGFAGPDEIRLATEEEVRDAQDSELNEEDEETFEHDGKTLREVDRRAEVGDYVTYEGRFKRRGFIEVLEEDDGDLLAENEYGELSFSVYGGVHPDKVYEVVTAEEGVKVGNTVEITDDWVLSTKYKVGDIAEVVRVFDGHLGLKIRMEDGETQHIGKDAVKKVEPQESPRDTLEEGDKVVVLGDSSGHRVKVGTVAEVITVDHSDIEGLPYLIEGINYAGDKADGWATEEDVRKASSEELSLEFQEGDLVKVVRGTDHGIKVGTVTHILEVDTEDENLPYKLGNAPLFSGWAKPDEIVKAEDEIEESIDYKAGDKVYVTEVFEDLEVGEAVIADGALQDASVIVQQREGREYLGTLNIDFIGCDNTDKVIPYEEFEDGEEVEVIEDYEDKDGDVAVKGTYVIRDGIFNEGRQYVFDEDRAVAVFLDRRYVRKLNK